MAKTTNAIQALYNGVQDSSYFPIHGLFHINHNHPPSRWSACYFSGETVEKYIDDNKDKLIAIGYNRSEIIYACINVGGKNNVYVYLERHGNDRFYICILFSKNDKDVNSLIDYFTNNILPDETPGGFLNILTRKNQDLSLEGIKIECPEIDFDINYNEGLKDLNESIISKLNEEDGKGLFLFHGIPGSGKTTYIRYLINQIKKKVIYIPPNLTNCLSDPDFITFFIKNANSVIIIEDAENILTKRSEGSNQAISNILNISDGLLGDCIKIQIIATFNTDLSNIDDALLRKGRLVAKYEFNELSEDRALKLSKKLGVDIPRTHKLADIYNHSEQSFVKEKKRIGF